MNIFVDENIPQKIVALLRAEGHKVEYVTRQVEDRAILDHAYQQQAHLITSDKVKEIMRPTLTRVNAGYRAFPYNS